MDSPPTATEPNLSYQPVASWSRVGVNGSCLTTPRTPGSCTPPSASTSTFSDHTHTPATSYPPHFDLLTPLLFSQHQAQLLHYNKLVAPGRGGGGLGLQPTSLTGLPPVLNLQTAPGSRSRSSSKVSNKDGHNSKQSPAAQNCHGTAGFKNTERHDREGMTMEKDKGTAPQEKGRAKTKDTCEKPHLKTQPDLAHNSLPARSARGGGQGHQLSSGSTAHSSSVPNTPQQRARNFSIGSRDPSPTTTQIPSPRSIYSEPNGGVASSLPARQQLPMRPCRFETAQFKQQRRMPYSLGPDSVQKVDPEKIKSKLSKDEERQLSTDMREIYDRLLPSHDVEKNREKLVQKLEELFNDEWPGHDIRVHRFGSSGNLLCSDDSDVDICITTAWKEMEGVCIIADLLSRRGMEKVVCVSGAKVPIVKIWDPELKLNCDMNVNNTLALENTRMIRTYVEIDERVRPLAMVIKYWTRRRVVNDAAYGATLSSYTWICMIVAFLQLRDPPVLPALHQMPHLKLPTIDGHTTEFADDLSRLRGWGKKNKSTIGELLFQFFRFFAHEFDYDNQVLSVRLGKMVHKKDKTEREWQHMNNYICVEEPFNKVRNLGNTADEFSFRGLHMEMRRAFDLVAAAKLEECCEQFVFPKHEPTESKVFVKPPPRPIMLRSSSQTHPGRGGRNGGRGNRNYRNGNSNRRASSSNAYENPPTSAPAAAAAVPHAMLAQGHEMSAADLQQWQLAQQYSYPANIAMLSNALMAQQDRFQQGWYAHQAQLHAVAQAQRAQGHAASTGRSRTNSFDQPPLSAPLRPEYFAWPPQLQHLYATHAAQQYHQGYGTYPSSPSTSLPAEFRRSLHRSNAANEGGSSNGGTLRSQSQPASRTPAPVNQPGSNYAASTQTVNGTSRYTPRQSNLSPFPAYAADERADSEADDISNRVMPDSPPEEDSARYLGYFVADPSPRKPVQGASTLREPSMSGASRRRLSADGPQAVLDRRLQRTSRSPSPAPGRGRNVSVGAYSVPPAASPFSQNGHRSAKESSPLVVNGSTFMPAAAPWPSSTDETAYDNPLHISQGNATNSVTTPESTPTPDRPLVVNGSAAKSLALPRHVGATPSLGSPGQRPTVSGGADAMNYATTLGDRNQNQFAHLDLAIESNPRFAESQHLSPVYEHRTPTPTAYRDKSFNHMSASSGDARLAKPAQKSAERMGISNENQSARANGQAPRENGLVRAFKVENDNASEWQQAKSRKKPAASGKSGKATVQSEKPPRDASERKGG
ncbi:unnamed protein product [Discula destructiva]